MSEIWHAERMYIQTENGTFVAQAFSLEDAAAIVREHNSFDALLAACKDAVEWFRHNEVEAQEADAMRAAIALAEGGER